MINKGGSKAFCSIVIVAFNPDERLVNNVDILRNIDFVQDIFVVDNSTEESKIIKEIQPLDKVKVISQGGNFGIGHAQNIGVEKSKSLGYQWVLTLDHDTIVNRNLFEKYSNYIKENKCTDIAILSTDYYDVGSMKMSFNNETPINVDLTISSGSLLNINIFNQIGSMKENYFIDQVDNEYCYRARKNGFKIVILPGCGMEHRLGKTKKVSIFGKSLFLYNQPPIRTFYRTRNTILFLREYKDCSLITIKIKTLVIDFVKLWLEDDSIKKSYQFFRGLFHGLKDKYVY